ncbi:MAG: CoA transferase [Proteobacteria bacterium]|nr:CoA transferase [Pseudomonadota bacterium]
MEPLSGIVVVEMSLAVQGPAAALYLCDMGAQVIKVEPPLGDPSRYGRGIGNETPAGSIGPQFAAVNRGKRSVCLDSSTELGNRAIQALLARADVFLTNYREPALKKMNLDYATLHERYPKLVYASVNGFGPLGPDADKAMLDGAAIARGGLASLTGTAGQRCLPGAIIADTSGAMQLALGVVTGLFARERHGVGQRVQTSALGAQLWLQQWELTHVAMTGAELERQGNHHPIIRGTYGVYETSDGGAIMIAHTMQQDAWDAFCTEGGIPELAVDPRCQTPGLRLGEGLTDADSLEIRALVEKAFLSKTAAEWDAFLRTQPETIFERVRTLPEVLEDEQSVINNYITGIDVPGSGPTKTVGNVVTLSETPGRPKGNPPVLGEANPEILGGSVFRLPK